MLHKVCLLITILVCYFEVSMAVECYQCNSEYDPRCGDPFESYSLGKVNCSMKEHLEHLPGLEPVICRKTTQKIFGKIRVVRGCGYVTDERDDRECVKRSGTFEVQTLFCSCTKDLCNSAITIRSHHLAIVTLPIVIYYYYKMFVSINNVIS